MLADVKSVGEENLTTGKLNSAGTMGWAVSTDAWVNEVNMDGVLGILRIWDCGHFCEWRC